VKQHGGKVESKKTKIKTHMGYFQEVDRWLDVIFTDLADGKMSFDDLKRDIRGRILESYRNGVKASGQAPAPRKSESRPPRRFARNRR
jgi:hypothetical protein